MLKQYLLNCSNEAKVVYNTNVIFNENTMDGSNMEHGNQEENQFFFGILTKTIVSSEATHNSGRTTRSQSAWNNNRKYTNLATIYTGTKVNFGVKITGHLDDETDPEKNPYSIFAIKRKDINIITKTIDVHDMQMLNHGNSQITFIIWTN